VLQIDAGHNKELVSNGNPNLSAVVAVIFLGQMGLPLVMALAGRVFLLSALVHCQSYVSMQNAQDGSSKGVQHPAHFR
jgi:tetrahydromethanopterin S-methyltransferase subunit E